MGIARLGFKSYIATFVMHELQGSLAIPSPNAP